MNQNILYEKKEELSKKSQDEIMEILEKQGAKEIKIDFIRSNIVIESTNEVLLNEILSSIVGHFNDKQDNFSLITRGFKVDED